MSKTKLHYGYSEEHLLFALERIQDGAMSYREASNYFGIPIGTLLS